MRRLITLIDALYEHKVLVHVLADAPIFELFLPGRPPVVMPPASKIIPDINGTGNSDSISDSADDISEANVSSQHETTSDSDSASMNVARLQHDEVGYIIINRIVFPLSVLSIMFIIFGNYHYQSNTFSLYLQVFAFDRTISRLLEIQSVEYVQSSLAAHPQGPDWILQVAKQLVREDKNNSNGDNFAEVSVEKAHIEENLLVRLCGASTSTIGSVPSEGDLRLWEAFVQKLWMQYRIGSIDEAQRQPVQGSGKVSEEVLRWEDAAVCLADLAEFAIRLTKRSENVKVKEDGEEEELVRQVQQKVLPDRLEALVQRRLTSDWGHGHHYITYAAFSLEVRELLLQVTRLRRR